MSEPTPAGLTPETPEAISQSTHAKRPHGYWIFFLVMMMFNEVFDTFNTMWPDLVVSEVRDDFGITLSEYTFYLGIFTLGMYFVFISQVLVDRVGRKPMLFLVFLGYGVSNLLLSFAGSIYQYTAYMFVLYTCFSSDVWTIMMGEEAPPEKRAGYISLILLVGVTAALPISLIQAYWVPTAGWRAFTWFGMLALGIAFLMLGVKETPAYLQIKAAREHPESKIKTESFWTNAKKPFRSENRPQFITILVGGFILGLNYIFIKTGEDFLSNQRGFSDEDIAIAVIFISASAILGFLITGLLSDRIGRKNTLYLFAVLLPIGIGFFTLGSKTFIYIGLLFAWMSFWALGLICRIVCMELFPTEIRGLATGWRSLLFAGGMTTSAFLTSALEPVLTLAGVYFLFTLLFLGFVPFFARAIRETKAVSLLKEQID